MSLIKKNIAFISAAAVGFLNFFWLIIPYVAAFVDTAFGSGSETISGYGVMSEFWSDCGFGGVMSGLFQIFALIAGILLLAVGALGLLRGLAAVTSIPESVLGISLEKIARMLLVAFAVIELLLLIFLVVLCSSNTEKAYGASAGLRFSAGMFISLAFALAGAALPIFIKEN